MVACPSFRRFTNSLLAISSILQISVLFYFNARTQGHIRSTTDLELFSYSSTTPHHHEITVDILSIGSQNRLNYIETQKRSFASHRSVRHFFSVTESDDADPTCASKLTLSDVTGISNYCRTKAYPRKKFLMTYLKSAYVSTMSIDFAEREITVIHGKSNDPILTCGLNSVRCSLIISQNLVLRLGNNFLRRSRILLGGFVPKRDQPRASTEYFNFIRMSPFLIS